MKVIIPAKKKSARVPDKNWRPFYKNKSLVEVKLEQLLASVSPWDIYLSCDDADSKLLAYNYGVHFVLRAPHLASDDTPWPDAFKGIIEELPIDEQEDIAWVEVINPLFNDFPALFSKWEEVKKRYDSLILTAPVTKFLLRGNGNPVNFMPGKWHAMSQNLEPLHAWDSVSIMNKRDMLYFSYPIGRKPFLFTTEDAMDIDTPDEFELAQLLYTRKNENYENTK